MTFMTVTIVVLLPVACIAAAAALMRLFDVKEVTSEQAQSDVENLLSQVNREVKIRRRVRAGAPSSAGFTDFSHFASLSPTRIRFPSA